MSYSYRSKLDTEQTRKYWAVKIGGFERLFFTNVKDATRALEAMSKGMEQTSVSVEHVDENGQSFKDVERGLVLATVGLDQTDSILEEDVPDATVWYEVVKCNGTGECSCWRSEQGHDVPDGWQEYETDGETRHMCGSCQEKDFSLAPPKQVCG